MEFVPVVEVVEVDSVLECGGVILETAGGEDAFTGIVTVIVAADRGVQFFDVGFVELHARLLLDPVFELGVAGAVILDEIKCFLAIESETIQDHLVITFAAAWVARSEFAAGFERSFEPEAWQVYNTEGASGSGTN